MSITTHTSTIREYVKNHTKDDIALFFEHQFVAKDAKIERLKLGLDKINAIRNSIVGLQSVNWSEHIYPLVAALSEAGFEGLPYPEAKKNVGTLLDQNAELNAEIERLKARNEFLEQVADQAIRILKYKDPELLDEMKEYGDINFSDFADYLKEKENEPKHP